MAQRRTGTAIVEATPTVTLTAEEYQALLNKAAKGETRGVLTCKVSSKGGISVYGLQRMPLTLYVEQWERLIDFVPTLTQFAVANAGLLDRTSDTDAQYAVKLAARDAAGILRPEDAAAAFAAKQAAAAPNGANPNYAASRRASAVVTR